MAYNFRMSNLERLPVVDQTTVREFVVNKRSPILSLIDDIDQRYPVLGNVITAEFTRYGEDVLRPLLFGALITAVLLEQAQKKVGGILPEQVSEEAVYAALFSVLDNTDGEVKIMENQFREDQKELFSGLEYFSNNIVKKDHALCTAGGQITLFAFTHILEAQVLAKKLGFKG